LLRVAVIEEAGARETATEEQSHREGGDHGTQARVAPMFRRHKNAPYLLIGGLLGEPSSARFHRSSSPAFPTKPWNDRLAGTIRMTHLLRRVCSRGPLLTYTGRR